MKLLLRAEGRYRLDVVMVRVRFRFHRHSDA